MSMIILDLMYILAEIFLRGLSVIWWKMYHKGFPLYAIILLIMEVTLIGNYEVSFLLIG